MTGPLLGGVEGGGTKFLAAIANPVDGRPPRILDQMRVTTTADPAETLEPIAQWFATHELDALGVAVFGPLDLHSRTIGITPKSGWSSTDVLGALTAQLDRQIPTALDTDVNGAGLGEWCWGAARGALVSLYITVGTGIGGGAIVNGSPLRGRHHPEMGHVSVTRLPDDGSRSTCPFHRDCLEGLASATALKARVGKRPDSLDNSDPVWDLEVHYLAHGLATLTLVLSPDVIVLGGGVMQRAALFERVSTRLVEILGEYAEAPTIVPPAFGQKAGLIGALALAARALPGQ